MRIPYKDDTMGISYKDDTVGEQDYDYFMACTKKKPQYTK